MSSRESSCEDLEFLKDVSASDLPKPVSSHVSRYPFDPPHTHALLSVCAV